MLKTYYPSPNLTPLYTEQQACSLPQPSSPNDDRSREHAASFLNAVTAWHTCLFYVPLSEEP